jgi:hypothetical protein
VNTQQDRFRHPAGYVLDYKVATPEVRSSPYLHVLFHGFSRIESHVPPVFARTQWPGWSESVCLFLSDPIHNFTRESACGWFLLGEDEFMPRVLELRRSLMEQWGLEGTVWHGLSSGAYVAVKYCMRAGDDDLAFVISPHNEHLRPILAGLDGHDGVSAVMLRDGRGHGFIADCDYASQLDEAIRRWEAHRSRRAAAAGGATR